MKKIIIIVVLLINTIFISKIKKVSLEKMNLSLKENELGIIFINNGNNSGLLLCLNDKSILYILNCDNYDEIAKYIKLIDVNVDYIVMNSDYNINGNKIVFNNLLSLNNIIFNRGDYIMISYNDKSLCINPKYNNCDYVYYTYDTDFYVNDNTKVFIYNDDISTDKIYDKWVDKYKVTENNYTIMKIKDDYEVLEILKNI